ncbi:MAG: isochorismatase family cysteine hydrolase [Sneathiella sp.]
MLENAALLVIDIQKDNVSPDGPYPFDQSNVDRLIETVNSLTASCKEKNVPVFFIRQVFDGFLGTLISKLFLKGITLKGEPGAELDDRLNVEHGLCLDKPAQNSFSKTDLDQKLSDLKIETVYIAGLDGAYCVSATAKGALKSGRQAIYVEDAIITNKPEKWEALKSQTLQLGATTCKASDLTERV